MRKSIATLALLFALAAPAQAGIAVINGGGTGGVIATGTNNTTLTITTGASTVDVPIGSFVALGGSIRAATSASLCIDSVGNTFTTPINKASPGSEAAYMAWGVTTIDEPIGTTWTCTTGSTSSKGLFAAAFSGVSSTPLDAASATPTNGTGTAVSVGPTGTLSCPGSGNCEVLIGMFAHHNIGTVTEGTGFTSFGTLTGVSSNAHMGYQIVAANTAITYAPTAGNSDVWAAFLQAFVQATGGATGAGQGQPLLGVTN